jgi:shikimate kinase
MTRTSGLEPAELIAVHGQSVYQRLLIDTLRSIIDAYKRVVITAGAGIATSPAALELLLSSSYVVRLKSSPTVEPEAAGASGRASIAQIEAARVAREPLLGKADSEIDATAKPAAQVMGEILAALQHNAVRPTGT